MVKKEALRVVQNYAELLKKEKIKPSKMYLFGSYVQGRQHEDSDIDVAVVINNLKNSFTAQMKLIKLSRRIDSRIEPHPFDKKDFNKNNPFAKSILKNAIVIK